MLNCFEAPVAPINRGFLFSFSFYGNSFYICPVIDTTKKLSWPPALPGQILFPSFVGLKQPYNFTN